MKRQLYVLMAVLMIASLAAGACSPAQPASTEMPEPATQAPVGAPGSTPAASCTPAQPGWDPTSADVGSKVITVAFEQEPDQLVGQFSIMSFAGWLWQTMSAGPGRWDDKNNLVPYMATEIPSADNGGVSADGLTVTWKLKPCLF